MVFFFHILIDVYPHIRYSRFTSSLYIMFPLLGTRTDYVQTFTADTYGAIIRISIQTARYCCIQFAPKRIKTSYASHPYTTAVNVSPSLRLGPRGDRAINRRSCLIIITPIIDRSGQTLRVFSIFFFSVQSVENYIRYTAAVSCRWIGLSVLFLKRIIIRKKPIHTYICIYLIYMLYYRTYSPVRLMLIKTQRNV